MKKQIIIAFALSISTFCIAQKKELRNAEKAIIFLEKQLAHLKEKNKTWQTS